MCWVPLYPDDMHRSLSRRRIAEMLFAGAAALLLADCLWKPVEHCEGAAAWFFRLPGAVSHPRRDLRCEAARATVLVVPGFCWFVLWRSSASMR